MTMSDLYALGLVAHEALEKICTRIGIRVLPRDLLKINGKMLLSGRIRVAPH